MKNRLKIILGIPAISFSILALVGLTIGWGIFSAITYWFLIVPLIALVLDEVLTKHNSSVYDVLIGLILFYALMIFMIYSHYKTDLFQIMAISIPINLFVATVVHNGARKRFEKIKSAN